MKIVFTLLATLASMFVFAGIPAAPVVVSQTQLYAQHDPKFGYLNRYVDFPLFLDNDKFPIRNAEQVGHRRISQSDLDFQRELVKDYGIDGFAFFTSWTRMENVIKANAKSAVVGPLMLPIIGFWHHPENDEAAFPEALENPCGHLIGGKQLILSYWTAKFHTPEQLKAKLDSLRAKYGDRFLLAADLPQAARSSYQDAFRRDGRLTAEQTKEYQDLVRSYLRACDGVYIGETHMMKNPEAGEYVFHAEYYRYILRLTREVLSEDEFHGEKLLGVSAVVGHENHYARGHNVSQDCTRTLRRSMEAAIASRPDFIVLPEWDEWNENTCFAPTVCNSFSTQRIVRYYMAQLGKVPLAKEGDDLSVPNLIVSYRRLLSPGERLAVEVLGIPDGFTRGRLRVRVELRNENGETVRTFPERTFDQERLSEMRFVAASEDLSAAARSLSVVLRCRDAEGRERVVDEGLSPIDLCSGNAWLHKSVKQPLRDLAVLPDRFVGYSGGCVTARLRCDRPIRYAMVVANGNVVKVVGRAGVEERFREDDETVAFAISDVALRAKNDAKAGFKFTVRGGEGVEWLRLADQHVKGNTLRTEWISAFAEPIYLRLKKSSLNTAELEIDFPGLAHRTVSLAKVSECGTFAVGEGVSTFGVRRFCGQARFPSPLNESVCSFSVPVRGDRRSNVYSVDVVTMDGKTWRSRALVEEPKLGESVCTRVWSAVDNEVKDLVLPRVRVPSLEYDLSDRCGDVVMPRTSESRFLGIFGGFVGAVSGYNRGHSTMNCLDGFAKWFATASDPRPRRESGGVLVFDGKDDIVGFPFETLPYGSGWTVEMDVMPVFTGRSEVLMSCRTKATGNLNGVFIENGLIRIEYVGLGVCSGGGYSNVKFSQRLSADEWNRVRLRYLVDALELTVNGVTERKSCVGPGQLPAPLQLGGVTDEVPGGNFFTGRIRNFRLDHSSGDSVAPVGRVEAVEMLDGEHWWGVMNYYGSQMPFDEKTNLVLDNLKDNNCNQSSSLLVSDHGRYVWCDRQTVTTIKDGIIRMQCKEGAEIEVGSGGKTLRDAYQTVCSRHFPPRGRMPDPLFFSAPQYNTWIELTYHQNEKDILAYAQSMLDNGLPPGVFMIDDTWQAGYGDWRFEASRFSNPKGMVEKLHKMGFKVILWMCPWVSMDTPAFRRIEYGRNPDDVKGYPTKGGFLMTRVSGNFGEDAYIPAATHWWNGYSALLDLTHPNAKAWFTEQLDGLVRDYGVDGFKFDGGSIVNYSQGLKAYDAGASSGEQSGAYAKYSLKYPVCEYRNCYRFQSQPVVMRLHDKNHKWEDLQKLIPDLIAGGLLGYQFLCPDMVGGGNWGSFIPGAPFEEELFVRSAQVHALCGMMQFSASPWRYLDEMHQQIIRETVQLRQAKFAAFFVELAKECGRTGEPMIRNLEYNYPGCGYASVRDEFMMGTDLLVAPVLEKGARARKVIVPEGTWVGDDGTEVKGPAEMTVAAPLSRLPHFVRKKD